LPNETKRFTNKGAIFDQIAGETNKIRCKVIDRLHDMRRESRIPFVVKIRKMNEARTVAAMQPKVSHAQQRGLDPFRIDASDRGQCEETEAEKFSSTDHAI
jgi:hypothetical protein